MSSLINCSSVIFVQQTWNHSLQILQQMLLSAGFFGTLATTSRQIPRIIKELFPILFYLFTFEFWVFDSFDRSVLDFNIVVIGWVFEHVLIIRLSFLIFSVNISGTICSIQNQFSVDKSLHQKSWSNTILSM